MRRQLRVMLLAASLGAPAGAQAPQVDVLWSYRDDHDRGIRWIPDQVVTMLRDNPNAYVALGSLQLGYPVGSPVGLGVGELVDEWQAAVAAYNRDHSPDLTPRICADWRPDLVFKHIDGSWGTEGTATTLDRRIYCGGLLDYDQCAPIPCSAHPNNPCSRWEGDMAKDWGESASHFDPEWLLRTDRWEPIVAKYHGGKDLCGDGSPEWDYTIDKPAICPLNRPDENLVYYGKTNPTSGRISVSGLGLDLRIPAAREWSARQLLSKLLDQGFDAGEPICVILGAKPGLWAQYPGPNAARPCPADEVNNWSGFETPANAAGCWGGAFVPTPYGPGEFEAALNEQLRVVWKLLAKTVPRRGRHDGLSRWGPMSLLTTERPEARGIKWWVWDEDVRRKLTGEMNNRGTGLVKP